MRTFFNASLIVQIHSVIYEILANKDFIVTDNLISWLIVVAFVYLTYVQIALNWGFPVQLSLWKSVHWLWRYKLNEVCDRIYNLSKVVTEVDIVEKIKIAREKDKKVIRVVKKMKKTRVKVFWGDKWQIEGDLVSGVVHTGMEVCRMYLEMSRLVERPWLQLAKVVEHGPWASSI